MGSLGRTKNMCPFTAALNSRLLPGERQKRRKLKKQGSRMMRGLTAQMEEVASEQQRRKEEQRQLKDKFKAIEAECDKLRKETAIVIQQSAITQIRLAHMFQILRARENRDFTKAAQLAQSLRELIMKQKA
ncbi:uncharacterized protein LOC110427603 [Herrania umbratica]|uniref:Uncharacterized protein LOC110427603 n=1 Tax=Herrania umbratica TaxID=108875 RepID=A0A6J1BHA3_9ROSI|nr:uncharacterized protein LOC110427603 [Herrania umbratica]